MRSRGRQAVLVWLAALVSLAAALVPAATAAATERTARGPLCADRGAVDRDVEQARLPLAVPQEILHRSGFAGRGTALLRALCRTHSTAAAARTVGAAGHDVWRDAVARVQGRRVTGDLPRLDDRPLYWSRLDLSVAVAAWADARHLPAHARAGLLQVLDVTSRGQDGLRVKHRPGVTYVTVTGFDPFELDASPAYEDIRHSNPSGSNALSLDGRTFRTRHGLVHVETAVYPVNWDPFAAGVVERSLLPVMRKGPYRSELLVTSSQGFPDKFTLEVYNGAARGGFLDNLDVSRTGLVPIPRGVPTVHPQPQFTRSSLPLTAMARAANASFPVQKHTTVVEIPKGQTEPVTRPNGPTPGSTAVQGGGGDYLSNEITYRTTLLRDALHSRQPVGHLHTPVLDGLPGDRTVVTSPALERNRRSILTEEHKVILAGAKAIAARQ